MISSCYDCNSALDLRCLAKEDFDQNLQKACSDKSLELKILKYNKKWASSNLDSNNISRDSENNTFTFRKVCKKILMKLPSRDPPVAPVDEKKSRREVRPAMPLRIVRYCAIERVRNNETNLRKKSGKCLSRIASSKMEIRTCTCYENLCNSAILSHNNHLYILNYPMILLIVYVLIYSRLMRI